MSYRKFIKLLEENPPLEVSNNDHSPNYELGEIYVVDHSFLFLLTGSCGDFYVGYYIAEDVRKATSKDLVFRFGKLDWVALLTHELYVPKERLGSFVGTLDEQNADILWDYVVNDEESGELLSEEEKIARANELKKVAHYHLIQLALDTE